jgi:DNA-binding MarR family transcriptional regulator
MDEVLNSPASFSMAELLNRDVVLELDALTDDCKTFFIEALLLWIHHYRMHEEQREVFKHALIIEEAHHILLKKKQQAEGGEAITDVVLREIRELGESIILIDQHPSLISVPALGNTNITIGMNLKHGADVHALSTAMLLTKDQYHYPGMLEVGKAIVKVQSRHPNPLLVSFPLVKRQRKISDADISEQMEGYFRKYNLKKLEQVRVTECTVLTQYDLSPQERDMLIDVHGSPYSSMSERYKRLEFNNRLGNRIKDCLVKKGLFVPVEITNRKGRIKLLELTEKGRTVLGDMGYERKPVKGEGGIEHEYWKHRIKDHYVKKGYQVTEEYEIEKGVTVDLFATKDGETIAIEVETGKSDIEANIRKLSHLTDSQVIFYAVNREVEKKIKDLLDKLKIEGMRVWKVDV